MIMGRQNKKPRNTAAKDLFIVVKIVHGKNEQVIRSTRPSYVIRELKKL